jgi:hypothetical protein
MMTRRTALLMPLLGFGVLGCMDPKTRLQSADESEAAKNLEARTIGDISTVANLEPTPLFGVGLVVGLNGTGGTCPPSPYRSELEHNLRKHKDSDVKDLIDSNNNTMVIVKAIVPPGARKNDPLDLDILLPDASKCTSLKDGFLLKCDLKNFDSTKRVAPNSEGPNRGLIGSTMAYAEGTVVLESDCRAFRTTTVSTGANEESQKVGRVWGGGKCLIDPPIYLILNPDQHYARVAAKVAERVNCTFPGARMGSDGLAIAKNDRLVMLGVPSNYRQNIPHFLRVVRAIPLERNPPMDSPYRKRLNEQLMEPAKSMSAALRLEALGEESVPVLRAALAAPSPLTRFAAAQSLAYLRKPACAEELAHLAREQPKLRSYCLVALSSLDESACHIRLAELMNDREPEVRYGAFRALRMLDDHASEVAGVKYNESFWIHKVALDSPPMIHILSSHRPEIVLFGEKQVMAAPFRIAVGDEFTVAADKDSPVCTIKRFSVKHGQAVKQCSMNVADVIKNLAEIGAGYGDVVDLLKKADEGGRLSCDLKVDALPKTTDIQDLASLAK